ncbi:PAS domain-containing hybrid sensor histidine kinase/response regulator [Curvivirga aplysinae]|uniref:PAS domain-containing hybrid sensor histidine kinase/response regulator n=1 Tax=Curvivirga aplysinae TaxID=2529852 RepID=UPI001C3F880F|nr:PAS domain S-box protein [Curvivirga aplysinae]
MSIGVFLLSQYHSSKNEYGFLEDSGNYSEIERIKTELFAIHQGLGFDGLSYLHHKAIRTGDIDVALQVKDQINILQNQLAKISDLLDKDGKDILIRLSIGLHAYDKQISDFIAVLNLGDDYITFVQSNPVDRSLIAEPLAELGKVIFDKYQQEESKKVSFLQIAEVYVYLAYFSVLFVVGVAFLIWRQRQTMDRLQLRSQLQLNNRLAEYKTLITNASDAIIYIDQEGVVKYVNPAVTSMFGYEADELLGNNVNLLLPMSERKDHDAYLKNARLHKKDVINFNRGALQGLHKNGSTFMIDLNVSRIEIEGAPHYAGILRDVSERERTQNELITLYQEAPIAYATIQLSDGRITRLNKTFESLLGYKANDLLDSNIMDYQADVEGRIEAAQIWANFFKGIEMHDQEVCLRKASGELIWVSISAVIVIDDEVGLREGRVTMLDISDRKEAIEKLEDAIHQAQNANDAKTRFLSNMSHELRTPLNSILGHAQLLLNSKRHQLAERQQRQVSTILSSGNHLLSLIDEVLDMARVESDKDVLSEEVVNMREVLQAVWEQSLILPTQLDKDVRFDLELGNKDFFVYADMRRLKQVFLNLLSNAVKYNKDGGQVKLSCEFPEVDLCRVTVSDTGYGIAEDKLSDVFSPFKRLGAELTQVEGTGIGLYLTKMLVENMGGGIGLNSVEGEGSKFWVEFPLVAEEEKEDSEPVFSGRSLETVDMENKVILYIEDNLQNISFMEAFVEELDNTALVAAMDGEAGLSMAKMLKPDAILLDINLPDIDGITVMQKMRTLPEIRDIPVAVVTSNIDPDIQDVMMNLGCKAYIRKPVDLALIVDFLEQSFDGDKKS